MLCVLVIIFFVPLAVAEEAKPQKKKIVASLRGSPQSIKKQNRIADLQDLSRIKNPVQRSRFKKAGLLVPIPTNGGVTVDPSVPRGKRLIRPETAKFIRELGQKHKKQFPKKPPLRITSGLRTVEEQNTLRRRNPNAIGTSGPLASSHPTGATIDIGRGRLSREQDEWLAFYLLSLEKVQEIEAVREKVRPCYHIMVFRNYGSYARKMAAATKLRASVRVKRGKRSLR